MRRATFAVWGGCRRVTSLRHGAGFIVRQPHDNLCASKLEHYGDFRPTPDRSTAARSLHPNLCRGHHRDENASSRRLIHLSAANGFPISPFGGENDDKTHGVHGDDPSMRKDPHAAPHAGVGQADSLSAYKQDLAKYASCGLELIA